MAELFLQQNAQHFSEEIVSYALAHDGINWFPEGRDRPRRLRHLAVEVFIPVISQGVVYTSFKFQDIVNEWSNGIWSYLVYPADVSRRSHILHLVLRYIAPIFLYGDEVLNSFVYISIVTNVCFRCADLYQHQMIEGAVASLADFFILSGEFVERLHQLRSYVVRNMLPRPS